MRHQQVITNEVHLELNLEGCETNTNQSENYIITNETSFSLDDNLTHQNKIRMKSVLGEPSKALIGNEGSLQNLRFKIFELESKVKEYELILESHNRESHLDEVGMLKEKVQNLENENRKLKSTNVLNKILESKIKVLESKIENSDTLDLSNECEFHLKEIESLKTNVQNLEKENRAFKVANETRNIIREASQKFAEYRRKLNDMSGIGYKKGQSSLESNKPTCPKEKGKHTQKLNVKHNQKPQNHAFRYRYSNRHFHNHDRNAFSSFDLNKTYFKGPDGWFYELKNSNTSKQSTQSNGSSRVVSRQTNKSNFTKINQYHIKAK